MLFHIMDVNNGGEIIAKIESNNGKNALKKFIREYSLTIGFYEIKKSRFNWCAFSPFGAAWYAVPKKEAH